MKIIECQQGSDEWKAIRANHFTASEAPAMLGLSKYKTRAALLREKATGVSEDVDSFKQAAFDRGHEAEAAARPLVEAFLQEDLFPCTGTLEVEGLPLLASFDGLVMDESVAWENKLNSDNLAAMIQTGDLDGTYWPQCEQQLLVSGASRALFTTCDGEKIIGQLWYESKPERRAQLIAGWKQFAEDLKTYTPPEVIPAAVAEPQMALPALAVNVSGALEVRDNLAVFGDALKSYIERINKTPETDQDFANLEASAKLLREAQTKIAAARDSALGQVNTIDAMKRTADLLEELARKAAVECENIVKREKENRRQKLMQDAADELAKHIATLNEGLGKPYMPVIPSDFVGAIRNMKKLANIKEALDAEVARCKVIASDIAARISANLHYLRENAKDYAFLFADTATIVLKPKDDFEALAKLRIAEHKEAEAKRIEAETARIRAEEEAKAAAKVKAEQEEEFRRQAKAAADLIEKELPAMAQPNTSAAPVANVPAANEGTGETPAPGQRETPQDTGTTLKLGEINAALGLTVSAEFLSLLGFDAKQERNAKLYRACDFPRICAAIARHVTDVANASMRKAA